MSLEKLKYYMENAGVFDYRYIYRYKCPIAKSCGAPICPLDHAHPEIKLPMDPICRRREFQNIYAIWKQAKNKRVCPTAWFYCDADISIMGDLEDPRFLTFSAPGFPIRPAPLLHQSIHCENAPKSSKKTLDDYFPMEEVKNEK